MTNYLTFVYFTDQNFQNFCILPVYFKINPLIIVDNFVRISLLYTKISEILCRFRKLMLVGLVRLSLLCILHGIKSMSEL